MIDILFVAKVNNVVFDKNLFLIKFDKIYWLSDFQVVWAYLFLCLIVCRGVGIVVYSSVLTEKLPESQISAKLK